MLQRFGPKVKNFLTNFDGCGGDFIVQLALNCQMGGLIAQRYNGKIDGLENRLGCRGPTPIKQQSSGNTKTICQLQELLY